MDINYRLINLKMKRMKIKKLYLLMGLLVLSVAACEDANDWGYDPSHDRPFRPTQFETNP